MSESPREPATQCLRIPHRAPIHPVPLSSAPVALGSVAADLLRETVLQVLEPFALGEKIAPNCSNAREPPHPARADSQARRARVEPAAERKGSCVRPDRDHGKGIRVLANNIEDQRAILFPLPWIHSITRQMARTFTTSLRTAPNALRGRKFVWYQRECSRSWKPLTHSGSRSSHGALCGSVTRCSRSVFFSL
jgi:hypothetical protein